MPENYGFKIAKLGKTVFSSNRLDLLFDSQKFAFKILRQGFFTISVPASGVRTYGTINHGLSFTPAFLAFVQLSNTSKTYPIYGIGDGGEDSIGEATTSLFRIGVLPNGSSAFTAYCVYYLFANRIDA